ncbi:hypothetical protein VFPFJ_00936 [Purpureocillium lilacinum]|uniref:Uncharacterized protein n=1 Tax=Purpureocillium lilacinum TaxID=33203 RepID=A0A179HWS2_PURLI|nr:hypothetical protein VFPFJ_00936 [Purpureocillium lilacinum]OAQ94827.1 hypothetical protein VFPFJ_00936 [Purpureocillium lilacinum]
MVRLGAGMALTSTSPRWRFKPSSSMLDPPATTSPQSFGWMDGRSTQISPRLTLTHSLTLGRAVPAQRSAGFSYCALTSTSSSSVVRPPWRSPSRHPIDCRQPHLGRGIAEHVEPASLQHIQPTTQAPPFRHLKQAYTHTYDTKPLASSPSIIAYKNLSPKTRLAVGVGVIAWGVAGLYLSDRAEEKFGYTPSDKDKEELRSWTPRIVTVEKPDRGDK